MTFEEFKEAVGRAVDQHLEAGGKIVPGDHWKPSLANAFDCRCPLGCLQVGVTRNYPLPSSLALQKFAQRDALSAFMIGFEHEDAEGTEAEAFPEYLNLGREYRERFAPKKEA